ncbi:MAG: nucleotidyltransferase [Kiritimatiellaeota bacterium]|nr:nucleotidyltransferase [Kiritimatiellota bacterium]
MRTTQKPTLVVLAAGIGSRYGGLKQIEPIGPAGEIVIDYSIYDALQAGFGRIVFVIRRDIEAAFRAKLEPQLRGRITCDYVFQDLTAELPAGFQLPAERQKPWGTTHAVLVCRHAVREPFGVVNADDFYGRQSYQVLADFLRGVAPDQPQYALVGFTLRNTLSAHGAVSRGICQVDPAGGLQTVVERTQIERAGDAARYRDGETWRPLTGAETVSMNMWGFTPALFAQANEAFAHFVAQAGQQPKAECLLPTTVDGLVRRGAARVQALPSREHWLGVTYPEDKPAVAAGVKALIAAGLYPAPLWP